MVWASPLGPIPSDTAVVDDRGYPPAPQLGTAESYTPDRSSFYAQGVRCGSPTWKATGEPTRPGDRSLVTSTVAETWDGQLITAYNGSAGFS